ncbi:response regulator [Saccharibacter sp. 17.LH.SD]|uniref:response regulator n=1 Tax=Saccharibacter sp. 17.LH.SD TaxID=2689393 RepID=UPI00136F31B7|nr:response regulator [Saccharibacter sp. 17.LH.SD]
MSGRKIAEPKGLVLIVEDDASLLLMLQYNLEQRGYRVVTAGSAEEAIECLEKNRPDLAILDWMLPGLSGLDLCRRIREHAVFREMPVLFLTARSDEQDVIRGLDIGGDDYLIKPCSIDTLEARVRALLRRKRGAYTGLSFADLTLDPETHRVERGGMLLALGPTEYRILIVLMRHPYRVFSREDLLARVWGKNVHVEPRTIDVHIRRLRKALNQNGKEDLVRTVRSAGYALDDGVVTP